MKIFGIPVSFHIFRAPDEHDPVAPFQFDGTRLPRTHWTQYVLVGLVFFLVLGTLFIIGLDLAYPISQ